MVGASYLYHPNLGQLSWSGLHAPLSSQVSPKADPHCNVNAFWVDYSYISASCFINTEYDDYGKDNLEGVVYNGPFITYHLKEVISKKKEG